MKAVDANVVARYLVGDDSEQARIAAEQIAQPVYLSHTVLLGTAWLLSSRYRVGRAALAASLGDLLGLASVTVSDPELVGWALDRCAVGADLTDMLHVVGGRGTDGFVTFDRGVGGQFKPDGPVPIETIG